MWTLRQVYAKNLCAFKQLDYTLLQKHTTLIFGNNMDNDSQGSNGPEICYARSNRLWDNRRDTSYEIKR